MTLTEIPSLICSTLSQGIRSNLSLYSWCTQFWNSQLLRSIDFVLEQEERVIARSNDRDKLFTPVVLGRQLQASKTE
eukprot:SAG31_NODE_300_length_18109_cov_47.887285_6_plen_77_part_00